MKNVADIYSLSPMQALMLLHAKTISRDRDNNHDTLFNQVVYAIDGELNDDLYHRAWQQVVDRHPALRTLFVWPDDRDPIQVVRETATLPWQTEDWRHFPPEQQQERLDRFLTADRASGFDLMTPPLMRLTLIRVGETTHWLVWSTHHLIIDRWCTGILFTDVKAIYEALIADTYPSLRPAPDYRRYVAWLAEQDDAGAKVFWQGMLANLTTQPLPLTPQRSEVTPEMAEVRISLAADDWLVLRQFAAANHLTVSTLANGAWAVVMAAATASDDVLFGITVAGRPADVPGVADTVGCFINNVPLRIQVHKDLPTAAWLQAVQERQLQLGDHDYVSPLQLQQWDETQARSPLFDTLVVTQASESLAIPAGLTARLLRGSTQSGYPITLSVVPDESELLLVLTYDRQRVSADLANEMAAALQRVLSAMAGADATSMHKLRSVVAIDQGIINSPSQPPYDMLRQSPQRPPRTPSEIQMAQLWCAVLQVPAVSLEDRLFDLGADSINAVRLLARIEEQTGVRLPTSTLFTNPSVGEMVQAVHGDETTVADPVLLPLHPEGTKPPFFYVHGVFGDVANFSSVAPLLRDDQPLYGFEANGLQPDSEPDTSIEAMAERYVASMRTIQPDGPYYLGGYCFGAVAVYEMARQLEADGEETALLLMIEGSAPESFHSPKPLYDSERLNIIRQTIPYWTDGYAEFGGWNLGQRVLSKMGLGPQPTTQANGETVTPNPETDNLADYDDWRPEIQFQLREVNRRIVEAYVPSSYGGHVTLLRGSALQVKHALLGRIDVARGWSNLAQGGVSVHYVAGSHRNVLRPRYAEAIAATITDLLLKAQQKI